ncbi:hypothetical protein C8R46DRAFT_1226720 [Mycena filopes]|nr:hypothetical protein C8R46DRAFT_1226720 [Mycena filopes]
MGPPVPLSQALSFPTFIASPLLPRCAAAGARHDHTPSPLDDVSLPRRAAGSIPALRRARGSDFVPRYWYEAMSITMWFPRRVLFCAPCRAWGLPRSSSPLPPCPCTSRPSTAALPPRVCYGDGCGSTRSALVDVVRSSARFESPPAACLVLVSTTVRFQDRYQPAALASRAVDIFPHPAYTDVVAAAGVVRCSRSRRGNYTPTHRDRRRTSLAPTVGFHRIRPFRHVIHPSFVPIPSDSNLPITLSRTFPNGRSTSTVSALLLYSHRYETITIVFDSYRMYFPLRVVDSDGTAERLGIGDSRHLDGGYSPVHCAAPASQVHGRPLPLLRTGRATNPTARQSSLAPDFRPSLPSQGGLEKAGISRRI